MQARSSLSQASLCYSAQVVPLQPSPWWPMSSSECVKCCLSPVPGDSFGFYPSPSRAGFIVGTIVIIFCAQKDDCEHGLLPRCSPQAGEKKKKGKQSCKDGVAEEERNGLIPPAPLNSYQQQSKAGIAMGLSQSPEDIPGRQGCPAGAESQVLLVKL